MSVSERSSSLRHELKYAISEGLAVELRNFVRSYLELEEHGVGRPDSSYPVHSLYLDSKDHQLYWRGIKAPERRVQLRIRYYDEDSRLPVFLETKQWRTEEVMMSRAAVRREEVHWVMAGQLPDPTGMVDSDAGQLAALQRFLSLKEQICAHPMLHVSFRRECYVSAEGGSWVSLDRGILCEIQELDSLQAELRNPCPVMGDRVLLKLQFNEDFPDWFPEMVRVFNLNADQWDHYLLGLAAALGVGMA